MCNAEKFTCFTELNSCSSLCSLHYDSINVCLKFTARVWIEPTSYTVNEDAATVDLIVRSNIPGGPPNGAVQFHTEDGTAIST